ncbi:MAG TPA: NAD(P)-dependent oxidoreductase [Chloroflexota bacterium]
MGSLITGLGYVGSALALALRRRGEPVVALENFFSTPRRLAARLARDLGVHLVEGSVASPRSVDRAFNAGVAVDTVYHLAAQASAHPEAASPWYTERSNLTGARLVFEAARRYRVRTVVLASSFRVYGAALPRHVDEDTPYGRAPDLAHLTKIYVEKLLELLVGDTDTRGVAVRLGLVYGPAPVMKRDPRFMTAPNRFCLQATTGEPLVVHPSGLLPTTFIHVDDAAQALLAAATVPSAGFSVFNAGQEVATVAAVAHRVAESARSLGLDVVVRLPPSTGEEPPAPTVTSRLERLGFRQRHTLSEGLEETLHYFLATSAAPPRSSAARALRRPDALGGA